MIRPRGDAAARTLPREHAAHAGASDSKSVCFLAVGDFGRQGGFNQRAVAGGMAAVASSLRAQFVVSTGDNVYPAGITSGDDPRWRETFSDIYTAPSLAVPWYAVLGNHDWVGNVSAQTRGIADARWRANMSFSLDTAGAVTEHGSYGDAPLLSLFYVDTTPWVHEYRNGGSIDWVTGGVLPPDAAAGPPGAREAAWRAWEDAQAARLASALNASSARWRVVVGHHAVYSYAREHGSQAELARLNGILRASGVAAYVNGHDHNLQVIRAPGDDAQAGPLYVTSGAGSQTRDSVVDPHDGSLLFSYGHAGFSAVQVTPHALTLTSYDMAGQLLDTTSLQWADRPQCGAGGGADPRCSVPRAAAPRGH